MCRKFFVVVAVTAWALAACAADTVRVESRTATPGQTNVLVRVLIDHAAPIYAMSFAAKYPTASLTFREATLTGTVFTGGASAEYFQEVKGADYCGAAIVLDLNQPYAERTLPAGTGQFACGLYFDVAPTAQCGDTLTIDLRSDAGSPVVDAVFTVVEAGSLSKSVVPTLTDGAITVSIEPVVTSISPNRGTKDGGTAVTISGQNFNAAAAATTTIGGLTLVNPKLVSPTTITGTTRPHAVGAVEVVVSNSCGTDSLVNGFTYFGVEPIVAEVVPRWGVLAGGTPVTISGENFDAVTSVTIGGLALVNKVYVNATTITGNAPAHAAGLVDVVVTNGSGSNTLNDGFGYVGAPTIESVSPSEGNGDVNVIVTGSGFTDLTDTVVLLSGMPVEGLDIASSDVLTFHVPPCSPGSEWLEIEVYTTGGRAELVQAYNCGGEVGPTFRRGNANCDANVDIGDAIVILGYLFSSKPVKCVDALNSNDSQNVDIADAIFLLGYLFTHGPPPPEPFATAGQDPTPDGVECAESCP